MHHKEGLREKESGNSVLSAQLDDDDDDDDNDLNNQPLVIALFPFLVLFLLVSRVFFFLI